MNQKRSRALRKLIGYTAPVKGSYDVIDRGVASLSYTPKRYDLVGKTIASAEIKGISGVEDDMMYDDAPNLVLTCTDGSVYTVVASYGCYTGGSEDEYPRLIHVTKGVIA